MNNSVFIEIIDSHNFPVLIRKSLITMITFEPMCDGFLYMVISWKNGDEIKKTYSKYGDEKYINKIYKKIKKEVLL